MKTLTKRIFGAMLAIILAVTMIPANTFTAPAFAAVQTTYATGDIVSFGSYPQTKVTNSSLITALNSCTLSTDNTVIYGGEKYKRVYFTQYTPFHPDFAATAENSFQDNNGYFSNTVYWFKYSAIQWRVLSNTDGELFVMAQTILDSRVYNQSNVSSTWETSTMRSWLNSEFYDNAFTIDEKSKIKISELINADNLFNATPGGNNTSDKLFLLAFDDMVNTAYGFSLGTSANPAREAQGTDYSKSCGLFVNANAPYLGNSYWWLRSPGLSAVTAAYVDKNGNSSNNYSLVVTHVGIRPACRIRLTPVVYATGDMLEYGSYPQSEVTDANLITALNACTLSADNIAVYGGAQYKKVLFTQYSSIIGGLTDITGLTFQDDNGYYKNTVYWFKIEPIQWRVLSYKNGNLFVIANNILDSKAYHQDVSATTWETCDLRSWLNNEFCNAAFTLEEKAMIQTADVVNADNPVSGAPGGKDTEDKLFLISGTEAINAAYGFNSNNTRTAQGSDYSKCSGLMVNTGEPYTNNSYWWLRSPGSSAASAAMAVINGGVDSNGSTTNQACVGVRPAFRINLQSAVFTPLESSTCVIDHEHKFIYGLVTGLDSLDGYVNIASGYIVSYTGTLGTGSRVNLSTGGLVIGSYKVIIFGDVNGDCTIDSIDAGSIIDHKNYVSTWDPVTDAAFILASDLNGDGNTDSIDAGIAVDAENYMVTIDQSTGLAS